MCYHVSYELDSIGLRRSKAVSMATHGSQSGNPITNKVARQSTWQVHSSQSDNPISNYIGARPFAAMDTVQCIKQIHKVLLTGYIVMKHYVQVAFSHIKYKLKLQFTNWTITNFMTFTHSLM